MSLTAAKPWPFYDSDEIAAATAVLRSGKVNYWTGEEGLAFEQEFAAATDCAHAIAVANGTLALDVALHALALPPGSEVIVTPRTFVASVSSVLLAGHVPVAADVDPVHGNVTAASIERVITPRTSAILCVHLGGWPCDMPAIVALAQRHGLRVIEDCAQANGARVNGRSVGSFGDVGAWSFCQDKIITTGGEGGMLTTNNAALFEAMWSFKDHGKAREKARAPFSEGPRATFRWVHDGLGTNARLTEVQAAIGRIQLRKLPAWRTRREAIARALLQRCAAHPAFDVQWPGNLEQHAWYRAYARVRLDRLPNGWDRDRLVFALQDERVPCNAGSCSEVYREAAFAGTPFGATALPNAAAWTASSIAFLVHPNLDDADVEAIGAAIDRVLSRL